MKKIIIFLLILAAIIVGVLITLKLTVNELKKEDIIDNLNRIIIDGSDSLYQLKVHDYEITGSFNGARINDAEITIDQEVFKKMQAEDRLPEMLFEGKVKGIVLEGIDILMLVKKNRDIKIKTIDLIGADFKIYQYKKTKKDTTKAPIINNLYERIKKDINSISIDNINIIEGKMSYDPAGKLDKKIPFWKFEEIDLKFKDLLVDSTSASDTSRFIYAKDFKTAVRNFKGIMGNDMYKFSMKECGFDHKSAYLEIEGLKMIPNASHKAFFKSKKFAVGEATIDIPLFQIRGIRSVDIIHNNLIKASEIIVTGGKFDIYKDKSFGDPPNSKNGQYPNQILNKMDIGIDIPKIILKKSSVKYTENGLKTAKEGIITFDNINGSIVNVTNIPAKLKKNPWFELNATTVFLNKSNMKARMAFDASDNSGRYQADAELDQLKAPQLQKLLLNLGKADLESFNLTKLKYRSRGDDKGAVGSMEMVYSDLKVNIMDLDAETRKFEQKKLLSFVANLLKIRSDNPAGKDEIKATNVASARPYFRGFFALVWFNVFDCMAEIAIKGDKPAVLTKNRRIEEVKK